MNRLALILFLGLSVVLIPKSAAAASREQCLRNRLLCFWSEGTQLVSPNRRLLDCTRPNAASAICGVQCRCACQAGVGHRTRAGRNRRLSALSARLPVVSPFD